MRQNLLKGKESYRLHQPVREFFHDKLKEVEEKKDIESAFEDLKSSFKMDLNLPCYRIG